MTTAGDTGERLQKVLARAGVASRRASEGLITAGRVTVNGQRVTELGVRVDPVRDQIRVDGRAVLLEDPAYYLLHKPAGMVTTLDDPEGRPNVGSLTEELPERVFPVGRLDWDAEGVLLLTNDGELANRLTHPRYGMPRTYDAKVRGAPDEAVLERLRAGVRLEDGTARPESVEVVGRAQRNTWIRVTVTEGRPHLVKRLFTAVGHPVQRLRRVSYAGLTLEGLEPGAIRALSAGEVRALKARAAGGGGVTAADREAPAPGGDRRPPRAQGRPTATPGGRPGSGGARRGTGGGRSGTRGTGSRGGGRGGRGGTGGRGGRGA